MAALASALTGCARKTKKQDLAIVALATLASGAIGSTTAPEFEKPEAHGLLWGSLAGISTALLLDLSAHSKEEKLRSEIILKQVDLEKKLRPSIPRLTSEGVVKKDAVLFEQKIPAGTRYRLFETKEFSIDSTSLKVQEFTRELELDRP